MQFDADGPASLSMARSVLQGKVDGLAFLGLHNIEFSSAAVSVHRHSKAGLQPPIEMAFKATTATIC